MKLPAAEIKQLSKCQTRAQGESALYTQLEGQRWYRGDRSYQTAGFDRAKGLVHFTATWALDGGGAGHSRLAMPLKEALECGGNLAQAIVLH